MRGSYRSVPATAHDFIRRALVDDTYPGMVARAGEQVEGVLYFDVDAQDVAALDAFEGCEYARAEIAVKMPAGEIVIAGTYIFLARQRLSAVSWEPQAFQMSRFIGAYSRDKFGR
ncbi:gamma-glutamylcyclotransferase family protein [Herminiimonas sp.]|uniref:gamma-glutamylcyclotransferase family protein n=1 Tax=Herminiimonas sp. TaxID=1926289 RepID=UPI0027175475|nr:gamma-glutamylcyclotransferase family protein [Herminiimonas sp.]MDO8305613.1 gamma-glutamylcyclotransferase family protein [Herminiimonas sp.]